MSRRGGNRSLTRRGLLGGLLAGVALPVWAEGPPPDLRPRRRGDGGRDPTRLRGAAELIAEADLGGRVSYVVRDAETGAVLEELGADEAMPPASTAKVITALYGLMHLGPGHRFSTQVLATGPVVEGRVQGDLILRGGGDPVLGTDEVGDLVARVAQSGIRGITGRFLVCADALPALARIDADQPEFVGYDPAISGLNLNFNRVHFEWKRGPDGWTTTMDARGERFLPLVRLARMDVVAREAPLFTYDQDGWREAWTVASAALGNGGSRWLPVRQPALYAAEVFATLAAAQGIVLPEVESVATCPAEALPVGRHDSAALDILLRDMLRYSTNLTAEVVGLSASGEVTLAGSARAMNAWLDQRYGIPVSFVDHSGLGGASLVSATAMVRALIAARNETNSGALLPGLLRDVGMRGADGKVIKDHPVRVLAKTGTLNFVSGLTGYVQPPGGRVMAFAIYAADTARRAGLTVAEREDPPGGDAWAGRARRLQGNLIRRWAEVYS